MLAGSINYRNKQFVIISFNISIHQQVKEKLDALERYFPDIENPKADKIISKITDFTWILLEERLERETGMYILPLNTSGKDFDYDVYNYPNTSINKAIRRGTSKFYLRIDVLIEPEMTQTLSIGSVTRARKDSFVTASDSTENKGFKPRIVINFTSYSNQGILPIEKFTGSFTATNPCIFEAKALDGIINDNNYKESNALSFLINEAITDLIAKIPSY
jgi:hypothetical protein